ncbi:ABC transporter ATP-binding protein [Pararhizobium sp. IMCC21322]|uniref:ABC transporter ATP-binding protein n=1 Tax=Pararhizobium sp. IMCC21322 TaxID=3067903 RepID=UPI0027406E11|nr:ABC transporter ATP-binding protein [Pararhizobium sp. IMCC21322]
MLKRILRPFERIIDPLAPSPTKDLPSDSVTGFIWYFARQAKWPFILFLLSGILVAGVEVLLFQYIGQIIDLLNDPAVQASRETLLTDYLGTFLMMAAVVVIGRFAILMLAAVLEQQVIVPSFFNLVRWQAHRSVIRQSLTYFQNDFAGRIATKVLQSGQAVGDFLINIMQGIWFFIIIGVSTIGVFSGLDWRLAGVVVVWFACYFGLAAFLVPSIRHAAKKSTDMRSVFNGRIVDAYSNIHTIKLFDTRGQEDAFAEEGLLWMLTSVRTLTRAITRVRFSLALLNGFFMATTGYICLIMWQADGITAGGIAIALGLVLRLNTMSGWMMFQISSLFRDLGTIQDSMETVSQVPALLDAPSAPALPKVDGAIAFDHVGFHYGKLDNPGVKPAKGVLHDITLDIAPGEKIGLVGRSGAGKSTLVNLLLRLYDVESGRITIDGHNIAKVTQNSLRGQISMVTQDTSLLHRSVRENILYGRPDASEADMIQAATQAEAMEFIADLVDPKGRQGFDAHVGERGVKLSGGQRQRIAIARVLLKDAPILILDEATSALDSEVEAAIQEQLFNLMKGKTVIAIAHRLSTIATIDRLVVMDGGHIAETGTHEALIANDGLYASLWHRQSGGFLGDINQTEAAQ